MHGLGSTLLLGGTGNTCKRSKGGLVFGKKTVAQLGKVKHIQACLSCPERNGLAKSAEMADITSCVYDPP